MFKAIVLSVLVVCSQCQLDIPKRFNINYGRNADILAGNLQEVAVPAPIATVDAVPAQVVAAAPLPINQIAIPQYGQIQSGGQVSLRAYEQVNSPSHTPIQTYYTQEVLPVQDLDVKAGPEIIQVRSQAVPVIVHFQSSSSPVQVEQSHIPGAPGEVTITRSEDEPHRVIHEVIRPVIQEVREIIQPYRRLSQQVNAVEERVHTQLSTRDAAPAQAVVAAPAPAPVAVAAPAGNHLSGYAPVFSNSYIAQIIEQLRANRGSSQGLLQVSRPQLSIPVETVAVQEAPVEAPAAVEVVEPVVQKIVSAPQRIAPRGGGQVKFSRSYAEYTH